MLAWLLAIWSFEFNLANQVKVPPCQSAFLEAHDGSVQQIFLDFCETDATSSTSIITECVESTDPLANNCQYDFLQTHYQGTDCNKENLNSTIILSNVC